MGTISLDLPPSYLRAIPSRLLYGRGYSPDSLFDFLRQHLGVQARPSLADLEGERARRGIRPTDVAIDEAPTTPLVLPMNPGKASRSAVDRADAASTPEVRSEARRNRARIEAAFAFFGETEAGMESTRSTRFRTASTRSVGVCTTRREPSDSARGGGPRDLPTRPRHSILPDPARRSTRPGPRCSTPTTSAASRACA